MTRNARVALSCSSDQGKGVDERLEWKASGVTVGGTGERIGENAVKTRELKRAVLWPRQHELWLGGHGSTARQRDDVP